MDEVVAAHIFPFGNADIIDALLGVEDINDPGNGLILSLPLEHAFDHHRISFVFEDGNFQLVIWDSSILDVTLSQYLNSHLPTHPVSKRQIAPFDVTFRSIERRALTFKTAQRPLKRCLWFHSKVAQIKANQKGWTTEIVFKEFWSEGMENEEKMERYFNSFGEDFQVVGLENNCPELVDDVESLEIVESDDTAESIEMPIRNN